MIRPACPDTIRAVGVVVPAHNEEAHIERCLRALFSALGRLPHPVTGAVCLVLDRCTDRTAERVRLELRRHHSRGGTVAVRIVENEARATVGALRDAGLRHVARVLPDTPVEATWLLSTDADTTVGPSWVLDHLRYADDGADVVAGLADLDDPGLLGATVRRRYARILAAGVHGDRHTHVYGANLGVRASAYFDVGGFPSCVSGEDHRLLERLRAAGHQVAAPVDLRVRTSSRRHGRASGGLADLLRGLPRTTESFIGPAPASAG